jgi:hypothetical protein
MWMGLQFAKVDVGRLFQRTHTWQSNSIAIIFTPKKQETPSFFLLIQKSKSLKYQQKKSPWIDDLYRNSSIKKLNSYKNETTVATLIKITKIEIIM